MKILILNGPNINLVGSREPDKYGAISYSEINNKLQEKAKLMGIEIQILQSNHEGELVDIIQKSKDDFDGIVINAGAYTHTSIAIRDAILAVKMPCVEIHLSNIYTREDFRHNSYISGVSIGQICGFGHNSYLLGLEAIVDYLRINNS